MATMAPTERKHEMRNGAMAAEPMVSFAEMLRALDPKIARHLKLPHWFPAVYERKDQCELNENERERFLCAYQTLIGSGTLGQFVKIHGGSTTNTARSASFPGIASSCSSWTRRSRPSTRT